MPTNTSDETATAYAYPTAEEYEEWKEEADEMGMSVSEWIEAMVSAGRKQMDAVVEPDEDAAELREQRNDLKQELRHARDRMERLEDQLHRGERGAVLEYVEANPGATYHDLLQHLADTQQDRLTRLLELLEGDELHAEDGEYYRTE